jgi:hypothetical protein
LWTSLRGERRLSHFSEITSSLIIPLTSLASFTSSRNVTESSSRFRTSGAPVPCRRDRPTIRETVIRCS